jgi:DNA-binding MarR family transcriptional regulator
MRASRLITGAIDRAVRPIGLTHARYNVLGLIALSSRGELRATKIGEYLMIHASGVTKLVDQLERDGLVQRKSDASDGRVSWIAITPRGRILYDAAVRLVIEVQYGLPLPLEDLTEIDRLLDPMLLWSSTPTDPDRDPVA